MNYSRLNCGKYFFVNRVVAVQNSLPAAMTASSSLYMFEERVFAHAVTNFCKGAAHTAYTAPRLSWSFFLLFYSMTVLSCKILSKLFEKKYILKKDFLNMFFEEFDGIKSGLA